MSKHKLHFAHKGMFIAGTVILAGLFMAQSSLFAETNSTAQCEYAYIAAPLEGEVISSNTRIKVSTDPQEQPIKVKIFANGSFIGEASNVNTSNEYIWAYDWQPTTSTSGDVNLHAEAYFDTTSSTNTIGYSEGVCATVPVKVSVHSQTTSYKLYIKFETALGDNNSWSGPVNTNTSFRAKVLEKVNDETPRDVTSEAKVAWSTSIGSITADGPGRANYFTGPTAGSGKIVIKASKNGQTASNHVYLNILQSDSSSTYPSDGDTADSDEQTETDTKKYSLGDVDLEICMIDRLGDDFEEKLLEGYRLKYDDIRKIKDCLAERRSVLPPNLAPVAPEKVRELREDNRVAVKDIKEAQLSADKKAIVLSGSAKTDDVVVLYIYSEPLVLTTTADENGNWSYTLDSPLEAGDHEVYVTVEDDDGEVVRSTGFNFSVAQVAATDDNPQGLSLALVGQQDSNTSRLLGLSMVVVLVGVFTTITIIAIRNKKHHHPDMKPEKHGVSRKA